MEMHRIALVSGANRGLGLSITKGLAKEGVHVLAGCCDLGNGKEAFYDCKSELIEPVQLDVKNERSVIELRELIEKKFGRLDALINNAEFSMDNDSEMGIWEKYQYTFDVNVLGAALLVEKMTPLLIKSSCARIVNISSILASFTLRSDPSWEFYNLNFPFYQASKAALNSLTLSQSKSLSNHGIKVNSYCPEFTATSTTSHQERNADKSARYAIKLALIDEQGPTGFFANNEGNIPW
ncbi:SDR family NAD(P)-dependent oxidoreductase [Halomonas sp. YLB-10]|uniref:SDR family NAD(P)-dependent oxidoreductase n=1 Tax=unclassified Halomonas TaxID=2609666 RepID=UPI000F5DEFDE|nr:MULTISPECIES: SDR family NAD(P)-dependent oxidoreductase [unclassified Halomonas]RQW68667.1 SDR family NAD(P)-dependent oxidoreductase [Halomonas sp. YLB-10]